ncbi:hypothetical protein HA402_005487 [Bradysia odoriphaga]|nr:hypothetical protein HA402_005487 [Bradysia odoriphaga]
MDELKYLTNKNNIQQVTVGLQKLLKAIRAVKAQGTKENQIKEIDFLRELCTSEYSNLSLLAHQAFVRLVEDGTIEAAACLSMFMTMLPNTKYNQYTAVTEGIVDLLLLDLKRRGALVEPAKNYTCPFGLKAPQHPIITLMQKNESSLSDLTNKINGICNHHDNGIRQHSIEFLRPVFLYTLCNPTSIPDSITIWTCLLSHVKKSNKAKELVDEILCYRKTSSATATLTTSLLLSDAITIMVAHGNVKTAVQFSFYLTAVLNDLVTCGYDPRPGFRIIRQAISEMKQSDRLTCDLLLILLNHSLHNVSPVYLPDVVRLLKLIIITMDGGNQVTRAMILDGLIVWIANFSLVPADGLHEIKELIDFIIKSDGQVHLSMESADSDHPCNVQFHHPSVAIGYQLAMLSHRLDRDIHDGDWKYLKEFLDSVQEPSQQRFGNQIQLFLRGIFLNDKLKTRHRLQIFEILLKLVKEDQDVATGLLLPVLFKLSREKEPIVQLELLRGLTQFAVVKENIPTILNTLNSMTTGVLRSLSLDLYLRLWKQENRTYPFLHKLLHSSKEKDKESTELTIAKAFTIKEICELKPTQHGTDLVVHLSNILNQSSGLEGETSTTLAIEAIIILCNSHTVNIASTWKALSQKFDNENRKRPTITLCKFFGQVPLLRSPTQEYEQLYTEAVSKLWHYILHSDCSEVISSALAALQNFDYCGLALAQIPDIFRQNLAIPSAYIKNVSDAKTIDAVDVLDYIPGQCWVQLIQKVNPSAMGSAADLVSHYIHNEIEAYRGGVYHLPEGKPEPNNLKQLHNRSPLALRCGIFDGGVEETDWTESAGCFELLALL